LAYGAGIIDY